MEAYKSKLFHSIAYLDARNIEELEARISHNRLFTINRNEEGKIHSRYLGDRYEPAIIVRYSDIDYIHYYLFDGDIKDCTHPFCINYYDGILSVTYYSSERIKNEEPIYITRVNYYYNILNLSYLKILDDYGTIVSSNENKFKNFTLVCDEMEELTFAFKFAD